jgi:hypothetical protein
MKRSARSQRIRSILIPLNLVLATAMLIGLAVGTPPVTLIAVPMVIVTAASAVAVLFER